MKFYVFQVIDNTFPSVSHELIKDEMGNDPRVWGHTIDNISVPVLRRVDFCQTVAVFAGFVYQSSFHNVDGIASANGLDEIAIRFLLPTKEQIPR